jgi:hypothetical protein
MERLATSSSNPEDRSAPPAPSTRTPAGSPAPSVAGHSARSTRTAATAPVPKSSAPDAASFADPCRASPTASTAWETSGSRPVTFRWRTDRPVPAGPTSAAHSAKRSRGRSAPARLRKLTALFVSGIRAARRGHQAVDPRTPQRPGQPEPRRACLIGDLYRQRPQPPLTCSCAGSTLTGARFRACSEPPASISLDTVTRRRSDWSPADWRVSVDNAVWGCADVATPRPSRPGRTDPRPAPQVRRTRYCTGGTAAGAAVLRGERRRSTVTTKQPGAEIAGYRIESLIGRTGMAVVYRAEDLRLGRKSR